MIREIPAANNFIAKAIGRPLPPAVGEANKKSSGLAVDRTLS
jgi:hypothetical protein